MRGRHRVRTTAILGLAAGLAGGSAVAQSTTYGLTSAAPYVAQDAAYDCVTAPAIPCAPFDTAMGVSGRFTVSGRLPSSASSLDLLPYVSGYAFSNGLSAFTDTDLHARSDRLIVSTDGAGGITRIEALVAYRWLGQGSRSRRADHIRAAGEHAESHANLYCQSVGANAYGVQDTCLEASMDGATASALGAAVELGLE